MCGSVEETLNELLEAEAEKLTQAARHERNDQRQVYRSGHYSRNLTTAVPQRRWIRGTLNMAKCVRKSLTLL